MITRDSLVLILGIVGSVVAYLVTAQHPPTDWTYMEWLQFASVLVGILLGWLRSSPLAGDSTPLKESFSALGGLVRMKEK